MKLTPALTEKTAQVIRATGSYVETAAVYAGITRSRVYAWLNRGKAIEARSEAGEIDTDSNGFPVHDVEDELYLGFFVAVTHALSADDHHALHEDAKPGDLTVQFGARARAKLR